MSVCLIFSLFSTALLLLLLGCCCSLFDFYMHKTTFHLTFLSPDRSSYFQMKTVIRPKTMHMNKVNSWSMRKRKMERENRFQWNGLVWYGAIPLIVDTPHNDNKVIAHLIEFINICNASPHQTTKNVWLCVSEMIRLCVLISFNNNQLWKSNRKHMETGNDNDWCIFYFRWNDEKNDEQ